MKHKISNAIFRGNGNLSFKTSVKEAISKYRKEKTKEMIFQGLLTERINFQETGDKIAQNK